jgi:hypothetical protein
MSGPLFSPTPAPAPSSESNDSVALKILEGLKKREKLVPTVSDITKRRYVLQVLLSVTRTFRCLPC